MDGLLAFTNLLMDDSDSLLQCWNININLAAMFKTTFAFEYGILSSFLFSQLGENVRLKPNSNKE